MTKQYRYTKNLSPSQRVLVPTVLHLINERIRPQGKLIVQFPPPSEHGSEFAILGRSGEILRTLDNPITYAQELGLRVNGRSL